MQIQIVDCENLTQILPLIREYQLFYHSSQTDSKNLAHFSQLGTNSKLGVQFVILNENIYAGFATVYFLPSSVSAQTNAIINDLYIAAKYRGLGYGRALLEHCLQYLRSRGYKSAEWQTQVSNKIAQVLYDSLPTHKEEFLTYSIEL